ncbi:MAG: 4Fe-4S binding protein [Proteobacteria bacterium]|nr:4Fe-4S binding protein [Pseudomonadota bacterium]
MAVRNIIQIDEEKCDGCGLCVSGCAESALRIVDGKARLVGDVYCDGLGACLGECPNGALRIIQREAPDFDEAAVEERLSAEDPAEARGLKPLPQLACGCPGETVRELTPVGSEASGDGPALASALRNWPVQLHLVPTRAPFFAEADLLVAADCTGFALTGLHRDWLPGRSLIIACPKLDDARSYQGKLAEIFRVNRIRSLTVTYMTVPCCFGLVHLIREAIKESGRSIPLRLVKVDVNGEVIEETVEKAA